MCFECRYYYAPLSPLIGGSQTNSRPVFPFRCVPDTEVLYLEDAPLRSVFVKSDEPVSNVGASRNK